MTATTSEDTKAWSSIARIDRKLEMPDDPGLQRAAVWWAAFSDLPDNQASQAWATYVADAWAHAVSTLETLRAGVDWIDQQPHEMVERVIEAKARYDDAIRDWREGSEDWSVLEGEKMRRLIRYMVESQKRLVTSLIAEDATIANRVRGRIVDPYVAGYLSGLASNWCDSNGLEREDPMCREEMFAIFREFFGIAGDDAASIFFERWSGEVECVDGMFHAHEDVNSFKRCERGAGVVPRMRLFEYLAS